MGREVFTNSQLTAVVSLCQPHHLAPRRSGEPAGGEWWGLVRWLQPVLVNRSKNSREFGLLILRSNHLCSSQAKQSQLEGSRVSC